MITDAHHTPRRLRIGDGGFAHRSQLSRDALPSLRLGVREQLIFPEIDYDSINQTRGLDIAVTTNPGRESGARVLALDEVADAVATMPARPRERVLDRREVPQWDRLPILLLLVGLLAAEWALRKRWHLV